MPFGNALYCGTKSHLVQNLTTNTYRDGKTKKNTGSYLMMNPNWENPLNLQIDSKSSLKQELQDLLIWAVNNKAIYLKN